MNSRRTDCSIRCNLCGAGEVAELGRKDRDGQPLRTVICQECGLVWTDPRPSEEKIKKFYAEEYRVRYKGTWQPKLKHVHRGGLVARVRYATLRRFLKPADAILDVGSGGGELVYLLRGLGYDARGIEPNEGYARYAKDELKLPIAIGFFKELSLSEQIYDVITLYHVLEHLEDPFGTVAGLRFLLKPGGHLIIEVPNVEGICGEPAHRFHLAHLYNFNAATLAALARKAGYTVLETSISSDAGNVAVFLQKAGEPSGFDGRIPGNCDRIVGILARHTKLRHYLSAHPYDRALSKAARVFDEWRATKRFRSRAAILDALVARVKQEAGCECDLIES
jgi:2-polyprenyl-3-methyl-5-hydroxy-6-metoxy-1,4-benzoquinol methylase